MPDDYERIYQQYKSQNSPAGQVQGMDHDGGREKIIAVRKNQDGDIIAIRTDGGRDLDYVSELSEAKAGRLAHVDVFHKYGRDILRSEPDGIKENNLDNLPQF